MQSKVTAFRKAFLEAKEPLQIVGAHDGLGAQLIESHGFDGVWASGLEISASHGVPDANILTMTQFLERAVEMNTAGGLPVVADVDTGFGNSSIVHYMVKQYEAAGIAAVVIEDKLFPKVNSFVPGRQELISIPEFCGKLQAANNAKKGDMIVAARVEALIAGWGEEEALRRADAYVEAGADAILIHSKSKEPDEIRSFLKVWNKRAPIILVPTTYPTMEYEEMAELGVNMSIYANQCMRTAITAMNHTLATIKRERSTASLVEHIAPVKEIFELQGMFELKEHEKKYLRTQKKVKAIIPAAGTPSCDDCLKEELDDKPMAMLDLEGKPLLQRIAESLNLSGIQDIVTLVGYKKDDVDVDSVTPHEVPDFESSGILHSIQQAGDHFEDSVLLHYGDVLVSHDNIRVFVESEDPIVVMTSPHTREGKKKAMDHVALETPREKSDRSLERHPIGKLKDIGNDLENSDGEFVGLVLLNKDGISNWNSTIESLSDEEVRTLSLKDFLKKVVDDGHNVTTFEVSTGWSELFTKDDYDHLCTLLRSQR